MPRKSDRGDEVDRDEHRLEHDDGRGHDDRGRKRGRLNPLHAGGSLREVASGQVPRIAQSQQQQINIPTGHLDGV